MDRTDETEDEVDFRPRSPVDALRKDECGVSGAGDSDVRRRTLVGVCTIGALEDLVAGRTATVKVDRGGDCTRRGAEAAFSLGLLPVEGLDLEPGDLARLANQCFIWLS